MELDKLTLGELKEIKNLLGSQNCDHPFEIGKNYMIRTVTMIQVGKLLAVGDKELVLEDAAWVADTGKFSEFLSKHETSELEIEPFPDGKIIVGRGAIIDATVWTGELLRKVK